MFPENLIQRTLAWRKQGSFWPSLSLWCRNGTSFRKCFLFHPFVPSPSGLLHVILARTLRHLFLSLSYSVLSGPSKTRDSTPICTAGMKLVDWKNCCNTNWIGLILRKRTDPIFSRLVTLVWWMLRVAAGHVDGVRPVLYHLLQRGLHLAARLGAGRLRTGRLRHAFHSLLETLLARIRSPFLQSKELCLGRLTRCRHIGFCFLCTSRYVPLFSPSGQASATIRPSIFSIYYFIFSSHYFIYLFTWLRTTLQEKDPRWFPRTL